LDPAPFADAKEIGVTAGTSTLRETVAEVVARIESFGATRVETPRVTAAAVS
jgi:4-hydroxy-3-methylbut-2-enyl diphosphate reductase IspH